MYPWGDERRYNSYSGYFRRTFGSRIQKLSVNAGFSCPNRDGTLSYGGCTFCSNEAFTPSYCRPGKSVRQQLQELLNKQQEIQGSIDLCRKLAADHAYDGENIDFYLNYVKEEEKKGHSFAQLEELVGDFSEYSEFYKVSGDPVFQFLFCKVKNQKLFGWVWFALWIALSVFFIVEFGFGDGHMPLVVKAIVIGAVLVLLWYDFIRYCRKKRKYTVKYRKTTAP